MNREILIVIKNKKNKAKYLKKYTKNFLKKNLTNYLADCYVR